MAKKATVMAVVNQKGGTGKTTTTENLGVGLAMEGKKVLVVDTDPQASLTISLGYPVPDELPTTLSDMMEKVMMEKPIEPGEGILHHPEGIDLMPSNIELSGLEVSLVNAMSRETILRQYLDMSVPEMGRLLGLCKTESYWLIKKNYFKTITVGGTMRVMIDSFENWYANQFKYQKVDGTPPGEELKKTTYSVEELGQRLGLKEATAYELIAKGHFEIVEALGKRRITKESFERWYGSQSDYRTVEDQALDADIIAVTYGLPEIARMLGTHRQNIYDIASKGHFELIRVGRHNRVTKVSFDKWYQSQSRYRLVAEDGAERS